MFVLGLLFKLSANLRNVLFEVSLMVFEFAANNRPESKVTFKAFPLLTNSTIATSERNAASSSFCRFIPVVRGTVRFVVWVVWQAVSRIIKTVRAQDRKSVRISKGLNWTIQID